MAQQYNYDILVIGGGAAGLTLALHLAPSARVALLSKGPLTEGATRYAQGGVSAVLDKADSIESHIKDTLDAGAGLCDYQAVQHAVSHGKASIDWLIDCGVPFTRSENHSHFDYHLTQEGGHSHRRVIHAADATGQAIATTLEEQIHQHPNIDVFEQQLVIDLITTDKLGIEQKHCIGAYAYDKTQHCVNTFKAPITILATGGAGKAYLYTSNPDVATGDGIAIAWRAGCRIANMEFIQFHPTCLYHPDAKSFLITEAVRGEGGKLRLPNGERFLSKYDEREELAPRDIVARAIDHEMKRLGIPCVYLDITHKPAKFIMDHFPTVYERCLQFGFDMTKEAIPVVPAAHYTCGGVMTDLHGRTDLPGLYAIGETAYTGFHGANRMASNSLLECLVYAMAAAKHINQYKLPFSLPETLPSWDESRVTASQEAVVISHNWDELRRFMWDYVGIVRSNHRLNKAKRRVDLLTREIEDYYAHFLVSNDMIELRNLTLVADLIIRSALSRKESRGLHFNLDYPKPINDPPPQPTVLTPENFVASW